MDHPLLSESNFDLDFRQVLRRSEIAVELHDYGFRYSFQIVLEDGEVIDFEGYANTQRKAMDYGIERSERMIERGYQEGM